MYATFFSHNFDLEQTIIKKNYFIRISATQLRFLAPRKGRVLSASSHALLWHPIITRRLPILQLFLFSSCNLVLRHELISLFFSIQLFFFYYSRHELYSLLFSTGISFFLLFSTQTFFSFLFNAAIVFIVFSYLTQHWLFIREFFSSTFWDGLVNPVVAKFRAPVALSPPPAPLF